MGRLRFVQISAPAAIAQAPYLLVDYSCPDKTGEWVHTHLPGALVERIDGKTIFNKPEALNCGIARACREGFSYLCFADADTVLQPDFGAWIVPRLRADSFMIAAADDDRDLTGLLVVGTEACMGVHGFDPSYVGWGSEDVEMRARLRLVAGLDFIVIPVGLVTSIAHDDRLRVANYSIKNHLASNLRNRKKLIDKCRRLSGDRAVMSRPDIRRLTRELSLPLWPVLPLTLHAWRRFQSLLAESEHAQDQSYAGFLRDTLQNNLSRRRVLRYLSLICKTSPRSGTERLTSGERADLVRFATGLMPRTEDGWMARAAGLAASPVPQDQVNARMIRACLAVPFAPAERLRYVELRWRLCSRAIFGTMAAAEKQELCRLEAQREDFVSVVAMRIAGARIPNNHG